MMEQLPINEILCGDCLDVLKELPSESIDFIVTSPPYNVGIDYGEYKDNKKYETYLDSLDLVWEQCFRVLRNGGRIAVNLGDTGRNPYYPVHCDVASRLRTKWYLMGIIIWNKQNCLSNTAWGSWMSASAPHLRGLHEFIIIAGKNGKFFRKDKKDDYWQKREFLRNTLEIWNISPESKKLIGHPAPFPVELPKRLIKLYSYPNDIVLDPFCGSGTSCVAAHYLYRKWIGIDINPEYCELARKRLEGVGAFSTKLECFCDNQISIGGKQTK